MSVCKSAVLLLRNFLFFFYAMATRTDFPVRRVVRRVRFSRPGNTDDTSNRKIGPCSHGFIYLLWNRTRSTNKPI